MTWYLPLISLAEKFFTRFFDNKDQADKALFEFQKFFEENKMAFYKESSKNIRAEMGGESWLQRNWRPMFMFLLMFIIAFIAIVAPLIQVFFSVDLISAVTDGFNAVPEKAWSLITLAMTGYIGGRTAEKGIKAWKEKD